MGAYDGLPATPLTQYVNWRTLHHARDERGRLTAIEGEQHTPFRIERVFFVHQVTPDCDRAGHAHLDTDQMAVAVSGTLDVELSDGLTTQQFRLDDPTRGLYLPRLVFTRLRNFSGDAVCMVLANTHYDRSKSLLTWADYLAFRGLTQA